MSEIIYDNIERAGTKVDAKLVQNSSTNFYKLLNAVDIDWNDAELAYIYAQTSDKLTDTSDLLVLIDEISRGNSVDWEIYDEGTTNTVEP